MSDVTCRLERPDGSIWSVERLYRADGRLRVDAVAGPPGTGGEADPGADRAGTLETEPLRRGDRLVWRADEGDPIWSMRVPVGGAEAETGDEARLDRPA